MANKRKRPPDRERTLTPGSVLVGDRIRVDGEVHEVTDRRLALHHDGYRFTFDLRTDDHHSGAHSFGPGDEVTVVAYRGEVEGDRRAAEIRAEADDA